MQMWNHGLKGQRRWFEEDGAMGSAAACEKKDVSVPFLLFAGFGTAMFAVIAGAIGMMYSMGSQDLPSVLAAGRGWSRSKRQVSLPRQHDSMSDDEVGLKSCIDRVARPGYEDAV